MANVGGKLSRESSGEGMAITKVVGHKCILVSWRFKFDYKNMHAQVFKYHILTQG